MSWAGWVPQVDGSWALLDYHGDLVRRTGPDELPPYDELDPDDRDEVYPDGPPV